MSKNLTDAAPRLDDAKLDALARQNEGVGDALVQGVRSGGYQALSSLNALAGGVGEAVGTDEFARGRYAAAQEAAQEAGMNAPAISSYKDVHGVRDALKYGSGLVGQMLPVGAAAIGGAALAGPVGAGAVMAPLEVGDTINRQQAAPGGPQGSAGERLLEAGLGGVGSAAMQAVVPASVAGKLAGRVSGGVLGLGKEAAMGAATGVGSEALKQRVVGEDNPDALKEAAVAGGVGGLAMGVPGYLAEGGHAPVQGARKLIRQGVDKAGQLIGQAKDAAAPVQQAAYDLGGRAVDAGKDLMDQGKSLVGRGVAAVKDAMPSAEDLAAPVKERGGDLGDTADRAIDGLSTLGRSGAAMVQRIARGESFALPERFQNLDGDALKQAISEDTQAAVEAARDMGTKLYESATSPEVRQRITDALGNLSDRANRAFIASLQVAQDGAKLAQTKVENLSQAFRQSEVAKSVSSVFKKSDDRSGVRKVVEEAISPYLQQHAPELLQGENLPRVGDALRSALGSMMAGKELSLDQRFGLVDALGNHTVNVLDRIRRAMQVSDPKQLESYFSAAQQLREAQAAHENLLDVMRKSLVSGPESASPQELAQAARGLVEWAGRREPQGDRGAALAAKFHDDRVRQGLQQYFGSDTDKVLLAAEKMIPKPKVNAIERARGATDDEGNRTDNQAAQGEAASEQHDDNADYSDRLSEVEPKTKYELSDNKLVLAPEHDPGKAGFQPAGAQRLAKHPDMRWVGAEELGYDHPSVKAAHERLVKEGLLRDLSLEEARQYADGEIGKYGTAGREVPAEPLYFSNDDLHGMRLDTHKFSKSRSRINLDHEGIAAIDAVKLTAEMRRRAADAGGEIERAEGGQRYDARMFSEGLAAMSVAAGRNINVPDSTVINKTGLTWGFAKKLLKGREVHGSVAADVLMEQGLPEMSRSELEQLRGRAERRLETEEPGSGEHAQISRMVEKIDRAIAKLTSKDTEDSRQEHDPFGPIFDALNGATEGAYIVHEDGKLSPDGYHPDNARILTNLGGEPRDATVMGRRKAATAQTDAGRQRTAPTKEERMRYRARADGGSEGAEGVERALRAAINRMDQENATMDRMAAQRAAVDRMAANEDYSRITPEKADSFLKAAKARYDELLAARQKLEDADMELPQDKARVLNNLMQLFGEDSHADLGSFYDGAKTDAEVRAMLEGTPDPKAVAAKKAAFLEKAASGDKALAQEVRTTDDAKGLQRAISALENRIAGREQMRRGISRDEVISNLDRATKLLKSGEDASEPMDALRQLGRSDEPELRVQSKNALKVLSHLNDQLTAYGGNMAAARLKEVMPGATTLGELTDTIAKHTDNPMAKAVAKAVTKVAGDVKVNHSPLHKGWGAYRPIEHDVLFAEEVTSGGPLAVHTVLHEGVHAATIRALKDDPGLHRALYALMDHVAKEAPDLTSAYGMTNTLEFLAEGFTNPGFQNKLKAITPHAEVSGFIRSRLASAWDSFVTLVRKALGLAPEHESALSQVIDLGSLAMKKTYGAEGFRPSDWPDLMDRRVVRVGTIASENHIKFKDPELQAVYDMEMERYDWRGSHAARFAANRLRTEVEQAVERRGEQYTMIAFDDLKERVRDIESMARGSMVPNEARLLETAKERMRELVQNPDTAYSLLTKKYTAERAAASGPVDFADAFAHIGKVLGNNVRIELNKQMPHAGEFERVLKQQGGVEDVIRLSVHALNPASAAYHESLHAFFARLADQSNGEIAGILEKAAASPVVTAQLRKLLEHSPEALAQLKDPEERAAYMYQFWAQGQLKLAQEPTTLFGRVKDFILKTLGVWSNDERALHILDYFHRGEFAKTPRGEEVYRALMEPGRNRAIESFKQMAAPLMDLGEKLAVAGHQRLRDTGIPALTELADTMKLGHTSEGKDAGFIPAARSERSRRMNALGTALHGIGQEDLRVALDLLQGRAVNAPTSQARRAVATVRNVLRQSLEYMRDAGVDVNDLGPNYFPRVWDTGFIASHQKEFLAMLGNYRDKVSDPQKLMNHLMANEGNEFGVRMAPGMQHLKTRVLDFIKPEDAERFLNKNLYETLNSYITQATRRAEWARRFGDESERLGDLLAEARRQGATPEQMETARKYVQAVDGTLGDDVNPEWRRLQGNLMVYQNLRLLPLAIFSSAVDPMGIVVRGGTVRDALGAFKRGIMNVRKGFQADPKIDAAEELAQTLGTIDSTALAHTLGTSYSQGMVGETGRKINDAFFRWNLMERFNTDMRVAATQAALRFLARHADGTASEHSARWIAELGLEAGDIQKDAAGDVKLFEHEGLSAEQATRMRLAVNRWVDGAVLRPDAADKPLWMSDPHYALVAHLKQFTFSFQETILKRMAHEAQNGNYGPALALASYVPIMIAADAVKGLIQGGGAQPSWKQDWDAEDYVASGVERAGLLGVGQLALDGPAMLGGPTLQQLGDVVNTLAGREQFSSFALHSMPANALYADWVGSDAAEARVAD